MDRFGGFLKVLFFVYAIGGMAGGFYIMAFGHPEPIPNYDDWGHYE
jgi:hypothetical protein